MIRLTVEIREGVLTHRTTVTASSIERALQTVEGQTGRGVRLILPIETEAFFVTEVPGRKEAT